MKGMEESNNRYSDDKVIDSCSLFGMMNMKGERFSLSDPLRAIVNMHERGNGLGGGFAIYGIYPDYKEEYALHIMYLNKHAKRRVEKYLDENFRVLSKEEVPTKEAKVLNPPSIWRYFTEPKPNRMLEERKDVDGYVVSKIMKVNQTEEAFVLSSGKDMGIFKGVGFPEEIAEYFCLDEYEGYIWICHGRFPTNTPGWWGGAQPFNILDLSVAHNGELSSYGANRRFLEVYEYRCTMQTDSEVLAYTFDLLLRKHKIPLQLVAKVLAPPFWEEIESMDTNERLILEALRKTYGSLLMNGPFSIIVARQGEMIGLTDRIKLRPLTAAIKDDFFYLSSEESAIRLVSRTPDKVWSPRGGEVVLGRIKKLEVLEAPLEIPSRREHV